MIVFPNCKINLGLNIIRKRSDEYHDIETVFYPLMLKDALETIESTVNSPLSAVNFSISGVDINGKPEDNLCIKAYELLKKDFPQLPFLQLHLHKAIPTGAGLGGGSADGAFTLKLLNKKFSLGVSTEKLIDYALRLGSDCPFFIINKPSFATGRGEFLENIPLDLSTYKFVIINPGVHVNTGWAFEQITASVPAKSIKNIIRQPVETWKQELKNDFEEPVFAKHPEIKKIKDDLYNSGAIYSSMSGSGSTVYGIFKKDTAISLNFPTTYFVKELTGKF
ncbi:MAG: 4-(cytidine 5'-diphospho)-2-C-methyl-D-erythritol kinase [Chitinophagaceae bacterium]|nr:MAG: 4-(cytidine 5'-diphospho)-2-C-methyl-D-erythritol kinase [Chitinophagaceae bacterium]